jgi:hypothetical protein
MLSFMLTVTTLLAATAQAADRSKPVAPSAEEAFAKLKTLAGDWEGKVDDRATGGPIKVNYRVTSGGSVVMETLFSGTDHEMVTMYHLENGKLVLVHYCAAGNQPRMKMTKASTPTELVFEFDGGTNLKAAKDMHMHSAKVVWDSPDAIRGVWSAYKDGKPAGEHTFFLNRRT